MITQLTGMPENMVAFSADGHVTEDDFRQVVFPAVEQVVAQTGKLNYLLVLNTELSDFTIGAWWQDALLGLKELTKWERVAILSNSSVLNGFTNAFSWLVPGEFRGFKKEELDKAVKWVSTGIE